MASVVSVILQMGFELQASHYHVEFSIRTDFDLLQGSNSKYICHANLASGAIAASTVGRHLMSSSLVIFSRSGSFCVDFLSSTSVECYCYTC